MPSWSFRFSIMSTFDYNSSVFCETTKVHKRINQEYVMYNTDTWYYFVNFWLIFTTTVHKLVLIRYDYKTCLLRFFIMTGGFSV